MREAIELMRYKNKSESTNSRLASVGLSLDDTEDQEMGTLDSEVMKEWDNEILIIDKNTIKKRANDASFINSYKEQSPFEKMDVQEIENFITGRKKTT